MDAKRYSEILAGLAQSAETIHAGRGEITRCLMLLHGEFDKARRSAEASYGDAGATLVTCVFSLPSGLRLQVRPLYSLHIYCDETLGFRYTIEGFDGDPAIAASPLFGGRIYGITEDEGSVSFKTSAPETGRTTISGLSVLYDFIALATQKEAERAAQYNGD